MTRPAPDWLAPFQVRFGAAIRSPLDRSSGTLHADPAAYDRELVRDVLDAPSVAGVARLAVYNRQYWFRLFDVLQSAFPLTARLMGYWMFNEVAARYCVASPPAGWDIDTTPDGFDTFLAADGKGPHAEVLVGAAQIDAAFRDVFRAPRVQPFQPSASDAARLLDARLRLSPALRLIEERHPLIELRARLLAEPDATLRVPAPLERARSWAILRREEATLTIRLEPREAALITALAQDNVRGALARVERDCPAAERASLPENARRWLARSVELGFYAGLRDEDPPLSRR